MFPMTEKAKYFPTVELFQGFIVLRPPTTSCQPTESRLQNDCEIKWHPSLHTTLNSTAPLALNGNPHCVTTFLESEYILWSRNYESYVGSQGETNRIYKINHSITVSTDSYHFERVFFFFKMITELSKMWGILCFEVAQSRPWPFPHWTCRLVKHSSY